MRDDALKDGLDSATALLRTGEPDAALAGFDACLQAAPDNVWALCGKAEALLELARIAEAFDAAENATARYPSHPHPAFVLSRIYRREGERRMETHQLSAALGHDPRHAPSALRFSEIKALEGEFEAALTILRNLAVGAPAAKWPQVLMAKIHEVSGDWIAVARTWDQLLGRFPGDPMSAEFLSGGIDAHARAGNWESAVRLCGELLEKTGPTPSTIGRLNTVSNKARRNLFSTGIFRAAFQADPGNGVIFKAYCDQLRRDGKHAEAAETQRRHLAALDWEGGDLHGALARIETSAGRTDLKFQSGVHTIWRAAPRGNEAFEGWLSRAEWGRQANGLVARHMMKPFASKDEFLEIYGKCADLPDLAPILTALARGRGLVLAGSHLGPTEILVGYLDCRLDMLNIVASTGTVRTTAPEDTGTTFIIGPKASGLRRLFEILRSGGVVANSPDLSHDTPGQMFPFGSGQIEISTLLPRLIHRTGAPSFWSQSVWRDGRVVSTFAPLPDPREGENRDGFVRRWVAAYLDRLHDLMLNEPEVFHDVAPWRALLR